jgi:hypothetical protein
MSLLDKRTIQVFADIDHAPGAKWVGLPGKTDTTFTTGAHNVLTGIGQAGDIN